jgi:hypothetical protein
VEQVVALVVGQPQRPGQGGEHLVGRRRPAALLEAREVVDRQARELRHLLAAQARHAAVAARRQSHVARVQAAASGTECVS